MTTPDSSGLTAALRELATLALATAEGLDAAIESAHRIMAETVARGGTLFFCGNGGSAADAQHIATEYVVRYRRNRRPYPAVALTTDTSLLTAAGNDLGFEHVFERQVEALGKPGDLLVIHSTSGNSRNVLLAAGAARRNGLAVLSLTAGDGGALAPLSDVAVVVPTTRTDRAQEIHLCIQHLICDAIEATL